MQWAKIESAYRCGRRPAGAGKVTACLEGTVTVTVVGFGAPKLGRG